MLLRKDPGEWQQQQPPRWPLHKRQGYCLEPKVFVKTAFHPPARTPTGLLDVLKKRITRSCPQYDPVEEGQGPIRPESSSQLPPLSGVQVLSHKEKPKTQAGLNVNQIGHLLSVNTKQIVKSFLEESVLIWITWWHIKMQSPHQLWFIRSSSLTRLPGDSGGADCEPHLESP